MNLTLGEKRVRTKFNPSSNSQVDLLKTVAADFINKVNDITIPHSPENANEANVEERYGEFNRLKALAMMHIEDAAMWAVKAATI